MADPVSLVESSVQLDCILLFITKPTDVCKAVQHYHVPMYHSSNGSKNVGISIRLLSVATAQQLDV